ncbi:uncharacterized protein LOC122503121 [Leptopilina heterotoma]|uniref:uncharacterized protein LOC122503121 n=1 Tax=Leptopilina heterotoma TaxID=63436 RepID=UPI001CA82EDD|nr:uncharacterized protein LOC122503121 [Leptopilina heterotoma]
MDSTDNNNANSLSSLPEIPITRISAISDNGSQLEFDQQLSGFMMLNKVNLEYIVNSRQEFSEQLIEANQTISTLREKLAAAEATPSTSGITNMAAHYKMLSDLVQEKQNLADQLAKHREETAQQLSKNEEEIDHFKSEAAKLKQKADSYEADYYSLLDDYNYTEKLYHRTRDLFRHKISEVFKIQSELREIRIRPRAPKGCLNCGEHGHSFKVCRKAYNKRFCQKCYSPDFCTDECPWPHVAEEKFDFPEHQRCKGCKRPKNLPDVNCGECRRREIEQRIANRDQQLLEVNNQVSNLQVTPKPPPAQANGAIPKQISLPKPKEIPSKSLSRAEMALRTVICKYAETTVRTSHGSQQ